MCARFSLVAPVGEIENFLGAEFDDDLPPRANIAPTLDVPALIETKNGKSIRMLRWGLIPYWADDPTIATRLINARSESALEKPAYRDAFRHRRCVIPANGFYEWREESNEPCLDFGLEPPKGEGKKQPYFFHRSDGELMALAGLWDRWKSPEGVWLETCTILTTRPNSLIEPFHDRMPCILERSDLDIWIDPNQDPAALMPMLEPQRDEEMTFESADSRLNNVRYEPYAA